MTTFERIEQQRKALFTTLEWSETPIEYLSRMLKRAEQYEKEAKDAAKTYPDGSSFYLNCAKNHRRKQTRIRLLLKQAILDITFGREPNLAPTWGEL